MRNLFGVSCWGHFVFLVMIQPVLKDSKLSSPRSCPPPPGNGRPHQAETPFAAGGPQFIPDKTYHKTSLAS